jgi:integrase
LSAALESTDPLARKTPKLSVLSERFLRWLKETRLDEDTKTYYRKGCQLLSATKIPNLRLDAIDQDVIDTVAFPGGPCNANRALRTLRRMLHKAEEWKLIRRAPKVKLVAEYERTLRLDDATEQKLVAGAVTCKWRKRTVDLLKDVIVLVRDTGLRNERELYEMRVENLDFQRRIIVVPDSKTPAGRREVPMSKRVQEVLHRRCEARSAGWLFPSKRARCGHLTTLAKQFRHARRRAGLPEQLVLYCGRHDFGSRVYAKTGNLKAVMTVMGHKDVKTAMRYQHPDPEIVRAALDETDPARTSV